MLLVAEHPRNLSPRYGFYIIDDVPEDETDHCFACSSPANDRLDIGIAAFEAYRPEAHVPNQAPMLLGFPQPFYGDVIFQPTGKGPDEEKYILSKICSLLAVPLSRLPHFSLRDVRIAYNLIPGEI